MIKNEVFQKYQQDKDYIVELEEKLCQKFGSKYAVVVSSGTAAIHCALIACGIKEDDEILVSNLTVIMTIMPIIYERAIPVFIDSAEKIIDFDYDDLEKKITPKTKAILPVYMWGQSYNMDRLKSIAKKNKLIIIEDACQAQGACYKNKFLGTIGKAGCFSLKDGKIIASGEGGYILTDDKKVYEECKLLRNHCISCLHKEAFSQVAYNYRITNPQAYLALQDLKNIDISIKNREKSCKLFEKMIDCKKISSPNNSANNNFSPLLWVENPKMPKLLSEKCVRNSVGTFGLVPASQRKSVVDYLKKKKTSYEIKDKNCKYLLKHLLAIVIENDYNENITKNQIKIINTTLGEKK